MTIGTTRRFGFWGWTLRFVAVSAASIGMLAVALLLVAVGLLLLPLAVVIQLALVIWGLLVEVLQMTAAVLGAPLVLAFNAVKALCFLLFEDPIKPCDHPKRASSEVSPL